MQRALEIARQAVAQYNAANGGKGGIAAVARQIGISRPSLSLFLSGTYPAKSTAGIEAIILRELADRIPCPHLGTDIARDTCRDHATKPMPMSNPAALRHWQACRACPHNEGGTDA